jgi:hypothetical protein
MENKKRTYNSRLNKYTDEQYLEKALEYNTLKELRTQNTGLYQSCIRRGLLPQVRLIFPTKKQKIALIRKDTRDIVKQCDIERSKNVYEHTFIFNEKVCGRCFILPPRTKRAIMCEKCNRLYIRKITNDKDHLPYNVRLEFCHTIIKHHEKVFNIGIRVDDKVEKYLTLVGYAFIFKPFDLDLYK